MSVRQSMSQSMNIDQPRKAESDGTRKRVRLNSVDSVAPRGEKLNGRTYRKEQTPSSRTRCRFAARLKAIGDGGHHLRSEAHRQLYCGRKLGRSELNRGVAVLRLVGAHRLDDRARAPVLYG